MKTKWFFLACILLLALAPTALGQEASSLAIPDLHQADFGFANGFQIMIWGSFIILITLSFSLSMAWDIKQEPAHRSMLEVADAIYRSCKTYLLTQGKFLGTLLCIMMAIIVFYLYGAERNGYPLWGTILLVGFFSLIGVAGSYLVAWYGIRVNTWANSRTAFASLHKIHWKIVSIPLRAGMANGLFLISLELLIMVAILLFLPREIVGYIFLGFAVGESLGAAVLRLGGGIFTKIADIGADLMKIDFNLKEDDPRNAGVIADCVGDNAGDSTGPTADFFESYGVTGVAIITFIVLAVPDPTLQAKLIVWVFAMRFLMDVFSGIAYFINQAISERKYLGVLEFDFEEPLTRLLRIAATGCVLVSYGMSYLLLGHLGHGYWFALASIISMGTLAALLIPETTKFFSSPHSLHVREIVQSGEEGGSALTVLAGLVAGYFSAYWQGLLIAGLMGAGYGIAHISGLEELIPHSGTFALGLIAFGMLCMGAVNIATDSYGPVSDNAQSIFELSRIEKIQGIEEEIERDFGFTPDFELAKEKLEMNDACGNTFKATVKPVLIATAVAGATIMIFSIQLLLDKLGMLNLSLSEPMVLFGLMFGAGFIYWFSGASIQAVTAGAYRATGFVKRNLDLTKQKASSEDSQVVVQICTEYAQKGAWNIFIALITSTLAFALFDPNFFIAYLIGVCVTGLYQAIFMANAGGAWDNAKKVVEVILKQAGTKLHEASVVGDMIGDPFKDTTSVAFNPIIKFSTLFGLLAVEIALTFVTKNELGVYAYGPGHRTTAFILFAIALYFAWRSFYRMMIDTTGSQAKAPTMHLTRQAVIET